MPNKTPKIGLMGGGFDPIHWGHLGAAIESAYQVGLDRVLLSPTGQPPHKQPVASAAHRFEMTRLAALESSVLEVTRIEQNTPGPHYTVDALRRLHTLEPDAELYLIVGTDAANTLEEWHAIADIVQLARIIVVERAMPGPSENTFTQSTGQPHYNSGQRSGYPTFEVRWPGVAVSSTEIRRRASIGAPIEYLVPRSVADYLKHHQLYR
jgi:nicotinate-nucleotide adenylyltransferase